MTLIRMKHYISLGLLISIISVCGSQNIALRRAAGQNGFDQDAASRSAPRAVDGDTSTCADLYNIILARGGRQHFAVEWWVDLADMYRVDRVVIYNTADAEEYERLNHFVISVGVTKDSRAVCGQTYIGPVPRDGSATIYCNKQGRYVHFRRVGGAEIGLATLCEVQVYGVKLVDCSRCASSCDVISGCSRCPDGKQKPDCVRDCASGYYGDCTSVCGRCRDDVRCDVLTGHCPDTCDVWYLGDTCHTHIQRPDETPTVSDVTSSSVTVTWQQLTPSLDVTTDYGYDVRYKLSTGEDYPDDQIIQIIHNSTSTTNSVSISGLQYNTEYMISVLPYGQRDGTVYEGQPYPTVTTTTRMMRSKLPPLNNGTGSTNPSVTNLGSSSTPTLSKSTTDMLPAIGPTVSEETGDNAGMSNKKLTTKVKPIIIYSIIPVMGVIIIIFTLIIFFILRRKQIQAKRRTTEVPNTTVLQVHDTGVGEYAEVGSPSMQDLSVGSSVVNNTEEQSVSGVEPTAVLYSQVNKPNHVTIPDTVEYAEVKKDVAKQPDPVSNLVQANQSTQKHHTRLTMYPDDKPMLAVKPVQLVEAPKTHKVPGVAASADWDIYPEIPPKPQRLSVGSGIPVYELQDYVTKRKQDMKSLVEEFKSLPEPDLSRCNDAVTAVNNPKNRFINIFPYDDNRVVLEQDDPDQGDYINASYISGYSSAGEYIATQGAKNRPNTVVDLWRMVWQLGCNRIIMVANLVDHGKRRCAQYWPERVGEPKIVRPFTITMDGVQTCADYVTRVFTVRKGSAFRTVHQFHFTSWEDKNTPLHGAITLFGFYNHIRAFDKISKGPMVVHCSAGVGRTGTFIGFDILLRQAACEGKVDIKSCVEKMRRERMLMVQTKEQYVFLHDALLEYTLCGHTSYPSHNFIQTLREINKIKPELGGISQLDKEFEILTGLRRNGLDARGEESDKSGLNKDNRDKNRNLDIIPADTSRPYLSATGDASSNYINAAYVSSYRVHGYYIATQLPLPHTVIDFWRMVYDQQCHAIVMLHQLQSEDPTHLAYWSNKDEPKQTHGDISVELLSTDMGDAHPSITIRDFRISSKAKQRKKLKRTSEKDIVVRHFQLLSWPNGEDVPCDKSHLLDLLDLLQSWQQETPRPDEHVIVQCLDGVGRCGVFCAVSHTLDRMKAEQECDAFLSVRHVTRNRPQFITNKMQYKFLYEMANEFQSQNGEYVNVQFP